MSNKVEVYEVRVHLNGVTEWYQNDKLHRLDGPAVETKKGDKFWYHHGKQHRTDGPAIEFADGDKFWIQNGKQHRTDGPAIEFASGNKYWYIDGKNLREKEFNNRNNNCSGKIVEIDGVKYTLTKV